jgi:hypothetical protein
MNADPKTYPQAAVTSDPDKPTGFGEYISESIAQTGTAAVRNAERYDEKSAPRKSVADIRERMEVVGSCGNTVGVVDHVRADAIQLTRRDAADGRHHFVPLDWVAGVDDKVHLDRDCGRTRAAWATETATA